VVDESLGSAVAGPLGRSDPVVPDSAIGPPTSTLDLGSYRGRPAWTGGSVSRIADGFSVRRHSSGEIGWPSWTFEAGSVVRQAAPEVVVCCGGLAGDA
jgi:hypothetical protein